MRTSVDLPDQLMKQAKLEAIERGVSFKDLVIVALERELGQEGTSNTSHWKNLRGRGSAAHLKADTSGFEGYSDPDWTHAIHVNDAID